MVATQVETPILNSNGREGLFEELYERVFPLVAKFVSHRRGTFQDAKDIFQDALVILYEKIAGQALEVRSSEERYILGIAKHLWIRTYHHDRVHVSLDDFESALLLPDLSTPSLAAGRLIEFLERTGKRCLEMLRAFYYDKLPMNQIASEFGYGNVHSATVQKYKCLEKVRDEIKKRSIAYEDFVE